MADDGWELIRVSKQDLPCDLTEQQMSERGHALGKLEQEISTMEKDRKAAMDAAKAEIDAKRAEAVKLSEALANKAETREVDVRIEGSFYQNIVRHVRADTGVEIHQQAMSLDERAKLTQRDLANAPDDDVPDPT